MNTEKLVNFSDNKKDTAKYSVTQVTTEPKSTANMGCYHFDRFF